MLQRSLSCGFAQQRRPPGPVYDNRQKALGTRLVAQQTARHRSSSARPYFSSHANPRNLRKTKRAIAMHAGYPRAFKHNLYSSNQIFFNPFTPGRAKWPNSIH